MKLKRFKERDHKRIGIILFTISCILLVSGVILYRTFAIFEVRTNQNVIKGTVQDPGDIYFAFYKDGQIQKDMPRKEDGYVLDESKSYCGVTGADDSKIKISLTEDWVVHVSGVTTSRTKCNLYFTKGIFIMGHGVPIVTSGDGLYKVEHNGVSNTLNDDGFSKEEYRYAGASPNNYVTFNGELWRIIGLVNVMTSEKDVEQRVKIIRGQTLGQISWNYSCPELNESSCTWLNNWKDSSLQQILNNNYFQNQSVTYYYSSNSDGSFHSSTIDFNNNYIKNSSSTMIDEIYWNLGGSPVGIETEDVNVWYPIERDDSTYGDNPNLWKGKIGLMYISDALYSFNNNSWLSHAAVWYYTLTSSLSSLNSVRAIYISENEIKISADSARYPHFVMPTLYLKPAVKIISGTGTSDDAFEIAQVLK